MAVIFYFSGTGNSLDVAKQTQAIFTDCRIENIAQYIKHPYAVQDKVIGIVCPVYCFDIPIIVKNFIEILEANPEYCFSIVTMGGGAGRSLRHLQESLAKKGINLNYADAILMPDNFFVTPETKARMMLTEADKKIRQIITCLHQRYQDTSQCVEHLLWKYLGIPLGLRFMHNIQGIGNVKVDINKCIGCGQCVKVCPVDNIILDEGKPIFSNKCVDCLACVRWCPKYALKNGSRGASASKNYTNPNIKVQELFNLEGLK